MKIFTSLLLIAFFSLQTTFAQDDDIKTDESLIIKLANVADKGYLSKTDLKKATTLVANEREAVIVSFTYSTMTDKTSMIEINNVGPDLNESIIQSIQSAKIGAKIYFDKILVENASGTVYAKSMTITVKS